MTKILSARDLLELVRQQDVEDRANEQVSEKTRGRRIYSNQRPKGATRASIEQRLPMIEAEADEFDLHKTLELQLPSAPLPPVKPKPQVVYDLAEGALPERPPEPRGDPRADDDEAVPSSRRRAPVFHKTLEMQLEETTETRPINRTIELPKAPAAPPSAPLPPIAPTPPTAPVAPTKPVRPVAPQPPVAPKAPAAEAPAPAAVAATRGPRNTQKINAVRPEEDPGLAVLAAELNASAHRAQERKLSPRPFQRAHAPVAIVPRDEPSDDAPTETEAPAPKGARRPSVQGWARKMTPADPMRASDTLPEIATDEAFRAALDLASAPEENPSKQVSTRSGSSNAASAKVDVQGWSPAQRLRRTSRPPARLDRNEPDDDASPESLTEPVALSGDETLVLLNYDQAIPLEEVAERTGLTAHRVSTILERLLDRGVIAEVAPDAIGRAAPGRKIPAEQRTYEIEDDFLSRPVPSLAEMAAEADADLPSTLADVDLPVSVVRAHLPAHAPAKGKTAAPFGVTAAPAHQDAAPLTMRDPAPDSDDSGRRAPPPASGEKIKGSTAQASDTKDDEEIIDEEAPSSVSGEELDPRSMAAAANYQRHYELVISNMSVDERAHLAATGTPADLFALCFDKEPGVVRALWENASTDSEHARFASFHHRTALGLERLFERGDFARDPLVQRRLIRNPLLSEPLLRRMLMPKRLIDIYKVMLDRDVPERTRTSARGILRTKYSNTEPEDRVQLIWNTEGRVLQYLTGLTIDSKAASLLCSRPVVSVMLVQSFCKFAATPPSVIHHCLKQPMIRRQIHLRNMLLKHPNCPSEAKRAF